MISPQQRRQYGLVAILPMALGSNEGERILLICFRGKKNRNEAMNRKEG
jgi:hypothetical protein